MPTARLDPGERFRGHHAQTISLKAMLQLGQDPPMALSTIWLVRPPYKGMMKVQILKRQSMFGMLNTSLRDDNV